MRIELADQALDDLEHFVNNDRALVRKIYKLIQNIQRTPFEGIGKPEGLKDELAGFWSRRINDEHRLVYRVYETADGVERCQIAQYRWHYKK